MTISQALSLAIEHHRCGNLQEAQRIYREILDAAPGQPDAWHLLGLAAHQVGSHDLALEYVRRAILADSRRAVFYNTLGAALGALGRTSEAIAAFQRAIALEPESAETHHNLGLAWKNQGNLVEALACYQRALALKSDYAEAHNDLGIAWREKGKLEEAAECFRRAIQAAPEYAEAYNNLGVVLREQGRLEEAAGYFRRAIQLKPGYAEACHNLGALEIEQDRFEEAVACLRRALDAKPDYAEAYNNLGVAWFRQGNFPEAAASLERAIALKPDYAEAHWNRAMLWLLQGDLERGWPEYEWRWRTAQWESRPRLPQPRWDGRPLEGQTILLQAEQGLGDMVQFIRYAPLVKERGGTVVVECPRPLGPLLARARGVDRVLLEGEPLPRCDVYAPLLSVPGILKTTLQTIPGGVPYLTADVTLVEQWREKLGRLEGFNVGIAWQGNPRFPLDRFRSIPLLHFATLAEVPGVRLISLQQGDGVEQLAAVKDQFLVTEVGPFDTELGAFNDRAAILMHLDLLVTSDSAIAHVAGALGVPVWVALSSMADWRWLLDREDSPWYPTMRLFRQTTLGDWPGVFRRIKQALVDRLSTARGPTAKSRLMRK